MERLSLHSWLDALSGHPIFKPAAATAAAGTQSSLLPPSPNASSIHSLSFIDEHNDEHEHELSAANAPTAAATACMIARKNELCVAAGSRIRILNLASFKAKRENSEGLSQIPSTPSRPAASTSAAGAASGYKTLNTPAIDFDIVQLVASPSSRFLAAVGRSQVVVLELPRKGWDGLVSGTLECSHDPIGPFYHSPSSPSICKVLFHPWGEHDSILLVMTSDGLVREYDILHDPDEPTQVTDFCSTGSVLPARGTSYGINTPKRPKDPRTPGSSSKAIVRRSSRAPASNGKAKARNGFGMSDDDGDVATSFCVGEGDGDWSAFTLYCTMSSGDIYCICPYLPKKARIPTDHLTQLASLISAKVDYLSDNIGDLTLAERQQLESRYSAQLKFVNSLLSQKSDKHSIASISADDDKDNEHDDEYMSVKYPSYLRSPPVRQGPFLLQPAPIELAGSDESTAADIVYIRTNSEVDLDFIVVAYSDGKIDVCLDVEKVEARWPSGLLADPELPSLLVYESIDLFGPDLGSLADTSEIRIERDPEYRDTLYICHGYGAHSLSLRPISDALHRGSASDEDALQLSMQAKKGSDVAWLLQPSLDDVDACTGVLAVAPLNDVYLGYALLLLTTDQQAVSIELSFRSQRHGSYDDSQDLVPGRQRLIEGPPSSNGSLQAASTERKAYIAFSDSSRFVLPPLLQCKSSVPTTRFSVPQSAGSARTARVSPDGKIELTIESLKFVGQTVEKLDMSIKDLIRAGNTVQERLELHLRELPRQVDKYKSLDGRLDERQGDFASFSDRLERVRARQRDLEKKADRVLQALIDHSQPDLSVYEQRWIEELGRVQKSVQAPEARQGPDRSLSTRAARLREQLELLKPQLQAHALQKDAQSAGRLGDTQKIKVEAGLAEEARLLADARAKIERMQAKLRKV